MPLVARPAICGVGPTALATTRARIWIAGHALVIVAVRSMAARNAILPGSGLPSRGVLAVIATGSKLDADVGAMRR